MKPQPRRRSYNDAAQGIGQDEPPAETHACSAHGCPLAGSLIVDGQKVCFVHLRVLERRLWDSATSQIRKRMSFVSAIEILRSPGLRTDAMALADARGFVPALDPKHDTRYKAMVAIESRLIAIALSGESGDEPLEPQPGTVVDAAHRFLSDHRMPS